MNSDFYDWVRHPITQVVLSEFKARYKHIQEKLVEQAATGDQKELAEMAGFAKAYRSFFDISYDDIDTEETQ